MDKDKEIGVTTPEKQRGKPFTKDDPRINKEGRPLGSKDFATDFDEVVEEIAEENGITKSQARKHLLKVAYKHAKEGNYSFYKDIHDRVYGTATNKSEIKIDSNTLNPLDPKHAVIANNYEDEIARTTKGE